MPSGLFFASSAKKKAGAEFDQGAFMYYEDCSAHRMHRVAAGLISNRFSAIASSQSRQYPKSPASTRRSAAVSLVSSTSRRLEVS